MFESADLPSPLRCLRRLSALLAACIARWTLARSCSAELGTLSANACGNALDEFVADDEDTGDLRVLLALDVLLESSVLESEEDVLLLDLLP